VARLPAYPALPFTSRETSGFSVQKASRPGDLLDVRERLRAGPDHVLGEAVAGVHRPVEGSKIFGSGVLDLTYAPV
jgi:hypothetical protein